ncbi:hypothetical protein BV25DRAFT_1818597 [Artomyces pyxidatus]|uniref:Uncharacterized protein n=1 Tax=Artomyces pyxidatus TaxID=48021 RepID=A0ACB8TIF0_9AGAM|nr:hypothetical protein BV25DRAFT_1818597 [Artomyces pyxidatus]
MSYLSLPHSPHSPDLPPYVSRPRRRCALPGLGRVGSFGLFLGTAAISGVLFHLFAFSLFTTASPRDARLSPFIDPDSPYYVHPDRPLLLPSKVSDDPHSVAPTPTPTSLASSVPTLYDPQPHRESEELSLDELKVLVSRTKGYFVRDFSLGLGWNNVRYIIEAALLQSQILNRTLVLPSFVYARGCEYNISVCAEYAPMVNKGDAVGWEEWRKLPIEQQMGWRIPMPLMLNMTHLRERYPVILISDYLRLHGMPTASEHSNGAWIREEYHTKPYIFEPDQTKLPSLYVIENWWYDPSGVIRVDFLPEEVKARGKWNATAGDKARGQFGMWTVEPQSNAYFRLKEALKENQEILDWEDARKAFDGTEYAKLWDLTSDKKFEEFLNEHGWEVLYTFRGVLGMDYTKTVVDPIRQVVPRYSLRGFTEDYQFVDADVVLLAGETHLGRKPGALRFTTPTARKDFANMVTHSLVAIDTVLALGAELAQRMRDRAGGRLWMGAHMRRGDFLRLGWAMEKDPEDHVKRVKHHLEGGRAILSNMQNITTYDLDGVTPNMEQVTLSPPQPDDPFYIATDERDPHSLQVISSHGAVFMNDLLTIEDRRAFGWPLMITDVRALVEQALLAHSAFFYGHGMSSVAGGIMNMRAVRGADPRTMLLD